MNKKQAILMRITEKYGEWIEMAKEDTDVYKLIIEVLLNELVNEKEKSDYLKIVIKRMCRNENARY